MFDSIIKSVHYLDDGRELRIFHREKLKQIAKELNQMVNETEVQVHEYEINLKINFESTSPEEAVQNFIDRVVAEPYGWVYGAIDLDDNLEEYMVDGYDLKRSK